MSLIYSFGANSHGQLGLGTTTEQEELPKIVKNLPFTDVAKIAGGGGHVLLLDKNGKLYSCGWNNKGQLGLGTTEDLSCFQTINSDETIIKISAGWDNSAAISNKGDVFVWGSNNFNQLGLPKTEISYSSSPIKLNLPANEKVIDISLCFRHSCILTESNHVYIFGKAKCLEIIKSQRKFESIFINNIEFIKLYFEDKIREISCGQHHILLLTEMGKVLMYGDNKFNQCGYTNNYFENEEGIKHIFSGWTHSGYLTENGNVYLWGRNNYGQLGFQEKSNVSGPNKLNISERIKSIQLGSEHGLLLTDNGKIYTWGWNEHGNCGNGNTNNVLNPYEVFVYNKKCIKIGCGSGFCYAVFQE